jgi:hypothetical protein
MQPNSLFRQPSEVAPKSLQALQAAKGRTPECGIAYQDLPSIGRRLELKQSIKRTVARINKWVSWRPQINVLLREHSDLRRNL